MAKGFKTGGRTKGVPNRDRTEFVKLLTRPSKTQKLVDKLFELADGVLVQEFTPKGEKKVYSRPPDRGAIEYIFDQGYGKPTQPVALTDPTGLFDASKYIK